MVIKSSYSFYIFVSLNLSLGGREGFLPTGLPRLVLQCGKQSGQTRIPALERNVFVFFYYLFVAMLFKIPVIWS